MRSTLDVELLVSGELAFASADRNERDGGASAARGEARTHRPLREAGSTSQGGLGLIYVGVGIFFFVALLCVFAYFAARKQRRRFEETGSLDK